MLNLSVPLSFESLADISFSRLLSAVKKSCTGGKPMHPEALKAVVFKLTRFSRDMALKQQERDEAADMASMLANAALKTYGSRSEFGSELLAGVQAITRRDVA
jgi:hypothetical protein